MGASSLERTLSKKRDGEGKKGKEEEKEEEVIRFNIINQLFNNIH